MACADSAEAVRWIIPPSRTCPQLEAALLLRGQRWFRGVVCWLCIFVWLVPNTSAQSSAQSGLSIYQQHRREMHAKFAEKLQGLATFCDEKQFREAAAKIRASAEIVDFDGRQSTPLPREVQPEIPADVSPDERHWQTQWKFLRREYAKDLYLLSRRALNAGYPSFAFSLVREVAIHDPDHRYARRLLGYERYGDEWVTPFAASMMRQRRVWHDEFGWLPKTHVERYERGERQFKSRWISAEKDAELRRDFSNAWEIRTDHFLIKTNHSLESGVKLGVALEDFYTFFHQTFAGFFSTPEQMQQLFSGSLERGRRRSEPRPFEVHYYRTQEEYNARLVEKIPQIAITNGLYMPDDRTSYFFYDPSPEADPEATVFHEATHQLFYESQTRDRRVGQDANFWVIEGIACYMESFRRDNGVFSIGDPRFIRFEAARYRLLIDEYYLPLERFSSMGLEEFRQDPNISMNYSQASGLSHFFMHYEDGRYRDALVQHLAEIYNVNPRRRTQVRSLEDIIGVSNSDLDRQYREYMVILAAALNEARQRPTGP